MDDIWQPHSQESLANRGQSAAAVLPPNSGPGCKDIFKEVLVRRQGRHMTKRGQLLWFLTVFLVASTVPSWGAPGTSPKAGNITALLPVAKITRGAGKKAVITDAKKGDELVWNDVVKTEKGGRARITLVDQSILSLGSQAELRIVRHDARSQQTALEMAYGRVRAQVANITRDGGSFELRTPTAVAGVIGTDFGVDSTSVGGDTFVCLAGAVQIANSDKSVPGSVQCTAGQTTTVQAGKPPSPPKPASLQQLQQMIEDTEPAIISSISPAAALPGATFDTNIAGQNMGQVNSVSVSGSGVTATLKSAATTGVQVHVVVDPAATPGPRTITLTKQSGSSSAAVFTVLGPPSGDPKAAYLSTLQQLSQTGVGGLGAFLTGAQQTADQVAQQVTNANLNLPKPIDLSPFATALNQQYGTVQTALQSQNTAIQAAAQTAATQFQTAYDAAYQALLQRNPSGTPDSTFTNAVTAAFNGANTTLQGAINGAQSNLNGTVQTYGSSLNQLQQNWIQNINSAFASEQPGPTPKVNALERIVDVGAVASFDVSASGGVGASVTSTNWTLCAPSYQPSGFGMALDPSTPACNAMPGFTSNQSEFDIATCSLTPGTYYARVLLTDSNNHSTPMDVKLTVLTPNYGTPSQTLRGLADAYGSLQYGPFSAFFDSTGPGITTYLNNMQTTLQTLNSMNINIVSSQDTITCNDAVTRANWQQNFTFKGSPNSVLSAGEQLTVTMRRTPGTGWLITAMSGDNGTVQGALPGPLVTNTALPDLVVTSASISSGMLSTTSASPVNPGSHTVQATISNVGNADLTTNMPVVISVLNGSSAVVATSTVNLPLPVSQGSSTVVTADLTFPAGADNTPLTLLVNVNPGCAIQEKACDGKNQQTYPLIIQNNTITFSNVTNSLTVSPGGLPGIISMDVTSTYYPVQVCSSAVTGVTITASNGGIKPGQNPGTPTCKSLSAAGTLTFNVAASLTSTAGTQNVVFTATNNGNPTQNVAPASQTSIVALTIAIPDLQFGSVTIPTNLQVGSSGATTVPVTNSGNGPAGAGWNLIITINGTQVGSVASGPAIPAGQTVSVPVTITVPTGGTPGQSVPVVLTVNSNGAVVETNTSNDTFSSTVTLVDFALTVVPTGTQVGVVQRAFSLGALSLTPSAYPLPITTNYSGLPAGLTGNGLAVSGAPTAAGTSTVTASGTSAGVTHAASGSFTLNILNEISLSETTSPSLIAGDPSQSLVVAETGGVYPVTLCATLPTGITTTAGTITGNVSCQTINNAQNVTWDLKADFTATSGNLTLAIHATDGGVTATSTPAGNVNFNAAYSVNTNANFQIKAFTVTGHTAPYVGANAWQAGEALQLQYTVANTGNGSPSGNITLTWTCGNGCPSSPVTSTVAAPASGQSVVITLPFTDNLAVASYQGTATLTTNISGAIIGSPNVTAFDTDDFNFSANTITPSQNLPIGGSGTLSVSLAVQVPSGNPFGVLITPVAQSGLTFTPPSQVTNGANITFNVAVSNTVQPGAGTIQFTATNFGVAKPLPTAIPVTFYTAALVPRSLFSNDSANPLVVPIATSSGAPGKYPDLSLQMTGNFVGGTAALSTTIPGCGTFTDPLFPTSAQPGDLVDWPIYADFGNSCPSTSQITVQAAIPNTNPATTQTVYTLYVAPKGLPQLKITSLTPPAGRNLSTNPWLAGEPMQWTATVQNVGSSASAGNEQIQIMLNGAEIGSANISGSVAANGSTQVQINTDAPDVPVDAVFGPTATLSAHIVLDTQGDLAPGTGDFSTGVNVSNWSLTVNGSGSSDSNPVFLNTISPTSGTAAVVVAAGNGTFNPSLNLPLVLGSYSSNQFSPSTLSPNSVSAGAGSTVTVSLQNGLTPLSGYYFVQVIAQMKDGGNVTTQRQATIHISLINDSANSPANITLVSDANNIASCVPGQSCGTPPATAQINGPLPDGFTLTASVSFCSVGPCVGNIDVSFNDTFMTATTPQMSTIGVTSPGNTIAARVKAATNADGSINTGPATVIASVSGVQAPFSGSRQPTPDPVGNNQFALAFNIGDIFVNSSSCVGIQPGNTAAVQLPLTWNAVSGFNVPSLAWEWEDSNHIPVGATPLAFNVGSGTSTFSSGTYSSLPTFNLTNPTTGVDGLETYYFAVTVSNGLATATKYFPFQFDLSQSQTFCPALGGNRSIIRGGQTIRGAWGKSSLMAVSRTVLKPAGKLPDLRVMATDVSFTPSMPKNGDTISVRFKVSNVGDADATNVPIALQVNNATVVSDTFSVPMGKSTLGALQWNNAQIPSATAPAPAAMVRPGRGSVGNTSPAPPIATSLNAAIVIDPRQTITQKTSLAKSASLAHFSLHDAGAVAAVFSATLNQQRVVLELGEGGCAGLRFNMGAGGCGTADVTVTVEDLAKGTYKLEAANGIADLGIGNSQYAAANFSPSALGQNGHTYAVQLRGGKVGILTMTAVRNPDQLSEAAKRVFNKPGARVIRQLGNSSGAPEPASAKESRVYFDISYQGQ